LRNERLDHYRAIDHEADAGFEIFGKTLEELYQNGAEALFSLIVDHGKAKPEKAKRLDLKDDNGLLVVFLNELLYFWDTDGFIPKEFSLKIQRGKLTGTVIGTIFDPRRDKMRHEVKAVTYHEFSVKQENGLFRARVIVDV
jgi:SHS2 domain-containing protein